MLYFVDVRQCTMHFIHDLSLFDQKIAVFVKWAIVNIFIKSNYSFSTVGFCI